MAGSARILLVAYHAAGPVPGRLDAVRTLPPQVVVGDRLHHAVTLPAGILRMADTARRIGLYAELAMPLHPGQIMAGRFNIPIHINVAGLAILSGGMGFIADLHNVIALQFWHRGKILIKYGSVAFLTLVRHRL